MTVRHRNLSALLLAACLAALLASGTALAADDDDDDDDDDDSPDETPAAIVQPAPPALSQDGQPASLGAAAVTPDKAADGPAKIGLVHDTLRRAQKKPSIADDYAAFKTRMEDEHGLTWSFSLSYRQRWISPDNIGTAGQGLFWPSLNWDIFDSETFGSGSFQFLYYGERVSSSTVKIDRRGRTLSAETPDYQNKFSQITYTHTLPGQMFAVAVGQYSFFNLDSNEYMADQQQNFVSKIFSANGSATYPTTGTGGYVQFNATKNLQFLAGGQSVNTEDPNQRPDGFLKSPYAWLGYVQWTPSFKGLGDAQYSLSLYQAPATEQLPASKGWSINAVQHLNDQWAVFGRLNASNDDSGGHKRSYALGVALDNPLGRADSDQIGIAYGSLEQKLPLPLLTLEHTENTLEAYWNWSLVAGLLLTPDIQYIRHPAFAPRHDSARIYSLRTTLVF